MKENDYQIHDEELEKDLFADLPSDDESKTNKIEISPRRKLAVLGLAFFSVIIVVLWGAQFSRNLETNPLAAESIKQANINNAVCDGPECFDDLDQAIARLRDTDGDGLTDMDEETIYRTSPYLSDTDSDGIDDGEEVKAGTDPNCPTGKDCSGDSELGSDVGLDVKAPIAIDALMQSGTTTALQSATTLGQTEVEKLRAVLLQSGMSEAMLSGVSDADIEAAYLETIKSMNASNVSNTNNISN